MAHLELANVNYFLNDGTPLLRDVSFRVGDGSKTALIGPNGTGKTTLLRLIYGDLDPHSGSIVSSGRVGVMRQFIGSVRDETTVREFLVALAPIRVSNLAHTIDKLERQVAAGGDLETQLKYAQAISDWSDARGYDYELLWDLCATAALGDSFHNVRDRSVSSLSGGEQKRLALEVLIRGDDDVLVLDEPDNYLDVPAKGLLESTLTELDKTVLFVTHDREFLSRVAQRVCTIEPAGEGSTVWTYPGTFADYPAARLARGSRLEEDRRRWFEEEAKLKALVQMYKQKAAYNSDMASRYQSAVTRLRRFQRLGPPEAPPLEQKLSMRLSGSRTGKRAVICNQLELTGLVEPFDIEIQFGDRLAVLGSNGSGKSHFLRLLALGGSEPESHTTIGGMRPEPVDFEGEVRLGARVRPGWFAQTHAHPAIWDRDLVEILHRGDESRAGLPRGEAVSHLGRYGLAPAADRTFGDLSGGQQARFQILLLELAGANLLLLDEPSDNLDLESVEALEVALDRFEGTVIAVTHDRWFARQFDRFLIFSSSGRVHESTEPVWDEHR